MSASLVYDGKAARVFRQDVDVYATSPANPFTPARVVDMWNVTPRAAGRAAYSIKLVVLDVGRGYAVLVATAQIEMGALLREMNLPTALSWELYLVARLGAVDDPSAREAARQMAALIASGRLPAAPEDPEEHAAWMTASFLVGVAVSSG
jgi:hypothetical protein